MAGSFNLGALFAVMRLDDQLSGPMTVMAQTVRTRAGEIGTKFEGVAVNIANVKKVAMEFSGLPVMRAAEEMAAGVAKAGGAAMLTEREMAKVNAVVNEAIRKYQQLGQTAPQHLVDLSIATTKVEKATREVVPQLSLMEQAKQRLSAETGNFTGRVKDMALGVFSGQAAFSALTGAGRAAIDFLKDSVTQAVEAEKTQLKLAAAVKAQGLEVPHVMRAYDDLATVYSKLTVHSDGALKETQALLSQVGGVLPDQMAKALQATTDLSAGLGVDLKQAATMVAKSFEDQFGALKKAGVDIDTTRASSEGLDYVLSQIQKKFSGQAQAEVDSYAGKIKQLGNNWDALKEQIGKSATDGGFLDFGMDLMRGAMQGLDQTLKFITKDWVTQTKKELGAAVGDLSGPFPTDLRGRFSVRDGLWAEWEKQNKKVQQDLEETAKKAAAASKAINEDLARDLARSAERMQEAIRKPIVALRELPPLVNDITPRVHAFQTEFTNAADDLAESMHRAGDAIWGGTAITIEFAGAISDTEQKVIRLKKEIEDAPKPDKWAEFGAQLSNVILGAFQGGGDAGKSIGGFLGGKAGKLIGDAVGDAIGGALGSAIGSFIPGIGTLLGGMAGSVIGKLFHNEGARTNDVRDEWMASMTSAHGDLRKKIGDHANDPTLMASFHRLYTSGQEEQFKAAALAFEKRLAELEGAQQKIEQAASRLGLGLKDRNRDSLVTEIPQMARALLQEVDDLVAKGYDHDAIIRAQASSWQELYDISKKYGLDIPVGMKAVLADLAKAGLIIDDVTKKQADKLNARMTALDSELQSLEQMVAQEAPEEVMGVIEQQARARIAEIQKEKKTIADEIEELTSKLTASFGEAAVGMVDAVTEAFKDLKIEIPVNFTTPGGTPQPHLPVGVPGFAGGTHGQYLDFGRGTLAMLHGRERISTEAEGRAGGGVTIVVNNHISALDSLSFSEYMRRGGDRVIAESVARVVRQQGW